MIYIIQEQISSDTYFDTYVLYDFDVAKDFLQAFKLKNPNIKYRLVEVKNG